MEQIYVFYHHHRFGHDIYLVRADREPTIDEVVKLHEIDYEPSGDEDMDEEFIECDYAIPADQIKHL